jgi:diamine N-acetyltransferase
MQDLIIIRKATIEDANLLAQLGWQTFYESFIAVNSPDDMQAYLEEAFTPEVILSELQDPDSQYFIAQNPTKAIGYAKLRYRPNAEELPKPEAIELQRIYVDANYQKLKVGSLLLNHCLKTAQNQGFKIIWLGVWEHNQKALAFYQKNGFTAFGSHTFQLGKDLQTDLLYQKEI